MKRPIWSANDHRCRYKSSNSKQFISDGLTKKLSDLWDYGRRVCCSRTNTCASTIYEYAKYVTTAKLMYIIYNTYSYIIHALTHTWVYNTLYHNIQFLLRLHLILLILSSNCIVPSLFCIQIVVSWSEFYDNMYNL